jgi:hypothetical protein
MCIFTGASRENPNVLTVLECNAVRCSKTICSRILLGEMPIADSWARTSQMLTVVGEQRTTETRDHQTTVNFHNPVPIGKYTTPAGGTRKAPRGENGEMSYRALRSCLVTDGSCWSLGPFDNYIVQPRHRGRSSRTSRGGAII